MRGDWRFHLLKLPSFEWLDRDLPLVGASVTRPVNEARAITGSLPLGVPSVYDEHGRLLMVEWGAAIIAEKEGQEPVFAIVDDVVLDGDTLRVQAGGFTMYAEGMPWMGPEFTGIQVDPMEMVRKIWEHLQSYEKGYLAVTVDETTSPVRIGTEIEEVSFTTGGGELVEFEAGPFRLANWVTDNLGGVLGKLQEETPFDFRERSSWDGEMITNRLELGYPGLGVRRNNIRFDIGYNVVANPPLGGRDYADEIWMQGGGEGRNKLKTSAHLSLPTERMRRVHVETDKSISSQVGARRAGAPILAKLSGVLNLDSVEVIDHELAPFGSFEEGDEVRITGDVGWLDLDMWVRILEITDDCDTGRRTMKVETV